MCTVLDKHAPPSLWKAINHNLSVWLKSIRDELLIAKRERRQAERKWRNIKLTIFKDLYRQVKHKASKLVHTAKCKSYTEKIALASSSKELHQIVNTLSNRHPSKILLGIISVLALLDFSSEFDTIDHPILVHCLHTDIGFTDNVLKQFSSYLTDRTNYISLSNHCSAFAPVHSGVPQGSVLGPILFTMYIKPLSAFIDSHSIIHHSFADDLQLPMSAPPDKISELLHSMQSCISDVKAWATAKCLNLMTIRQNSCLLPLKELSISITYLLKSLMEMLKFPSVCEISWLYIRLSSYHDCTCLIYCSDMLL